MADVFISYKSEERALASLVAAWLVEAGYSHWFDDRITPAEQWDRTIEREIAVAKAVLVLWTCQSVESDWVRKEAHYAAKNNKLVQIKCELCELPLDHTLTQFADLTHWNDSTQGDVEKALSWIGALVGRPPLAGEPSASDKPTDDLNVMSHSGLPLRRETPVTQKLSPTRTYREAPRRRVSRAMSPMAKEPAAIEPETPLSDARTAQTPPPLSPPAHQVMVLGKTEPFAPSTNAPVPMFNFDYGDDIRSASELLKTSPLKNVEVPKKD